MITSMEGTILLSDMDPLVSILGVEPVSKETLSPILKKYLEGCIKTDHPCISHKLERSDSLNKLLDLMDVLERFELNNKPHTLNDGSLTLHWSGGFA